MPARRRAPQGCRLSMLLVSYLANRQNVPSCKRQQNVKLFLREP